MTRVIAKRCSLYSDLRAMIAGRRHNVKLVQHAFELDSVPLI